MALEWLYKLPDIHVFQAVQSLVEGEKCWYSWGAALICYSQTSKCSLSAFPAGCNGMDSVTKKTRQDGSEVTERRKEDLLCVCAKHQISQKQMPSFARACMLTRPLC